MLFANRCTWAHAVASAASLLKIDRKTLLSHEEIQAIEERGNPQILEFDPLIRASEKEIA
jgi:hypothetical protein